MEILKGDIVEAHRRCDSISRGLCLIELCITRHRFTKTCIVVQSVSADFATLTIMLFIPILQLLQWNLDQLVSYLTTLEHYSFVPDLVPAEVRQDPNPEGIVDNAEQDTVHRDGGSQQTELALMILTKNSHSDPCNNVGRVPKTHVTTRRSGGWRIPRHHQQIQIGENCEQ